MPAKKGVRKKTYRIVPLGEKKNVFTVRYNLAGEEDTKTFSSRSDLISFVRGAEMFGVDPTTFEIVRSVENRVRVERP